MGCDIHLHQEVKIGKKWHHYNAPHIGRNYELFAKMVGVRNYGTIEPISTVKMLPDDLSKITKIDLEYWGIDGHSSSWFNKEEINQLATFMNEKYGHYKFEDSFGYLFENGWGDFKVGEGYPPEIEDIRFVFWFDN